MSFHDDFTAGPLRDLYAVFGVDGTVKRGTAEAPVRIIVKRDQEQIGDYGQAVACVTTVDVRVSEWPSLKEGDIVTWSDHLGAHSRKVDKCVKANGCITRGVLHG